MKGKRIIAGALAVMLLLSAAILPAAAAEDRPPEQPEITVVGNRLGDKTFEISLRVRGASIQTVGTVLTYDSTKLQPIAWDGGKTPVEVRGADWTQSSIVPTKSADQMAGKPALAYGDGDTGYLYLGAGALQSVSLDGADVVTVRFAYTAAVTDPEKDILLPVPESPEPTEDGGTAYTVDFAPADSVAVKTSIPGAQVYCTVNADKAYAQGEDGTTAAPFTAAFAFADGPSKSGGSGGAGDYAITFFDWDGRVIDAIAAPQNATEAVKTFTDALKKAAGSPLNAKLGYVFDQWLVVEQKGGGLEAKDTFTSNDAALSTDNADVLNPADLSKLTKGTSILVQAAYRVDRVNLGKPADDPAAWYTVSDPECYQFGGATDKVGQYSLTFTVSRRNNGGGADYGVTRARQPAAMVRLYPAEGNPIALKLDLDNTDETTFQVVVPKDIVLVRYGVIDVYGTPVWTTAGSRSDVETPIEKAAFVKAGAFALLMESALYAAQPGGTWDPAITAQTFVDTGYGKVTSANLSAAQKKLTDAIKALPGGPRILTRAEANAALSGYYTVAP